MYQIGKFLCFFINYRFVFTFYHNPNLWFCSTRTNQNSSLTSELLLKFCNSFSNFRILHIFILNRIWHHRIYKCLWKYCHDFRKLAEWLACINKYL